MPKMSQRLSLIKPKIRLAQTNLLDEEKQKMTDEYLNSEVCQECAECCKSWWFYTDLKDDAIRSSWLDTKLISVNKIKKGLWKITFHIPCKQLIMKDNKYYCKVHKGTRPEYCKTYPMNFIADDVEQEMLDYEKKTCPILKKIEKKEKS
jgi:Fe-S-cluster containining protein